MGVAAEGVEWWEGGRGVREGGEGGAGDTVEPDMVPRYTPDVARCGRWGKGSAWGWKGNGGGWCWRQCG